jgi:CheY-like chemotaxis protein
MTHFSYKILLVEDNPGDVLLIEESLRAADAPYEMAHCETVEAALWKIAEYAVDDPCVPDLLLVDYNLPGGDAREVIRASLRNLALRKTRRAVISSSLSLRDKNDAMRCGAECFLSKPADLDLFFNQVGSALVSLLSGPTGCGSELRELEPPGDTSISAQ